VEDPEIVADVREYKRSLRAFSVYEDREKLASIHEVQENLERWGRQYANMTIPSKKCNTKNHRNNDNNQSPSSDMMQDSDHDIWTELVHLEKRPIVLASGTRMMSRNAFKCPYGNHCIFRCQRTTTTNQYGTNNVITTNHHNHVLSLSTATKMTLIPRIEPYTIEDVNRNHIEVTTAVANNNINQTITAIKTKNTIESLRQLKSSLQFIAEYQETFDHFTTVE
jgi:hypothetical protein